VLEGQGEEGEEDHARGDRSQVAEALKRREGEGGRDGERRVVEGTSPLSLSLWVCGGSRSRGRVHSAPPVYFSCT
jgi:hypothetical protein